MGSMHRKVLYFVALTLCLTGCGPRPNSQPHAHPAVLGNEPVPLGRLAHVVMPLRYRVGLIVDPTKTGFTGHVEIDVRFAEKRRAIYLHGNGFNVLAASVRLTATRSIPAHYLQVDRSGVARLIFVDQVPEGKATIVIDYEAPFGKSLSGLYKVVDRGDAYAFTQFESTSAREAFPSFDEPGFKTPFQLSVTAPSSDKVVSNTPVQATSRTARGMTTTLFEWSKPLPTYLIALAVGPLDIVDGGDIPPDQFRARPVHLRGVTARGNGPRIRYALSLTPKIVTALENYFGISYPFQKLDVLAVPDFAAGAMENAGAITFRERLLLLDPDASVDQKRASLTVQAHELTHQWFGDLVTPEWWDDTWLNESFATWMEYKIASAVQPDEQFDTETLRGGFLVMRRDELASARRIHQPVNGSDDIENAFDAITYDKGASVLSMFEDFLGEETFRRGIHAYLTKFASRNATADDFVRVVSENAAAQARSQPEEVSIRIDRTGHFFWNNHPVAGEAALIDQLSRMTAGISAPQISASFHSFIDQPGVPTVRARLACGEAAVSAFLTQSAYSPIGGRPAARQWRIPACISDAGHEKICRLVDPRSSEMLLGASCPNALMPNAEGKGYYRFELAHDRWLELIEAAGSLDPASQITLLYNLFDDVRAGHAETSDLFALIRAVAPKARWDVLDALDDVLHQVRLEMLGPADIDAYRNFVRSLFRPRFDVVGLSPGLREAPGMSLARERLATLLVTEGRDPALMSALTRAGRVYLSGEDRKAVPAELIGEAMRAGLLVEGRTFADSLLDAFARSNQEYFRRQLVYAFAGADDPTSIQKLLTLAMTPRMRIGEIRYLYQYMQDEPVARATLWTWYKSNYSVLLARVSDDGMRRVPALLSTACDRASRDDLHAFFAPKAADLTGVPRELALAEEEIDRCTAFRQAKASEFQTALAALH
jgi:alanyl aminopeptidase